MPDKTPEERYREALKERLTAKPEEQETIYYSKTGFRKGVVPEHKRLKLEEPRRRRRIGLVFLLPVVMLFMISGSLRGAVIPLLAAMVMYLLIKRK